MSAWLFPHSVAGKEGTIAPWTCRGSFCMLPGHPPSLLKEAGDCRCTTAQVDPEKARALFLLLLILHVLAARRGFFYFQEKSRKPLHSRLPQSFPGPILPLPFQNSKSENVKMIVLPFDFTIIVQIIIIKTSGFITLGLVIGYSL